MDVDGLTERLIEECMGMDTDDPVKVFRTLIRDEEIPMFSRMHHIIVPLALITAYWNVVRDFDLRSYLNEAADRAKEVPEMICGYWGTCGSCVGTGIFMSVVTRTNPLTRGRRYGQCNSVTSESLAAVAKIGGPRCCKRNAVTSILTACEFARTALGAEMHPSTYGCARSDDNPDCLGNRCPYYIQKRNE